MDHELPSNIYLVGIGITAFGTIVVSWISTRGGRQAADKDAFTPQEHGEHAHTRDLIEGRIALCEQRILDRIELSDTARGLARQSEQRGVSLERVEEARNSQAGSDK